MAPPSRSPSPASIDPAFWRGKRVFLTGHSGFMGGWLALWLCELGAKVTGYALSPPTNPNFFTATALAQKLESHIADIRDLETLSAAMRRADPEIVFHLAAQPIVLRAFADPVETYASNVMGTVHVLQAMRSLASLRAGVMITTDKVYDNKERDAGYTEDDALGGREPYGNSKACAELAVQAFRESYFSAAGSARIATARSGNVVGGGDWAENRLVPDAMRAFSAGVPLLIRHPESTRPWQHVLEPLRGYLMLAERLSAGEKDFGGGWNFGPVENDVYPVAKVADTLQKLWGEDAQWKREGAEVTKQRPYEASLLAIDISKARTKLGWKPVWSVAQTLENTVSWYKAHTRGHNDMAGFSLSQIREFSRGA